LLEFFSDACSLLALGRYPEIRGVSGFNFFPNLKEISAQKPLQRRALFWSLQFYLKLEIEEKRSLFWLLLYRLAFKFEKKLNGVLAHFSKHPSLVTAKS
jgi:hypothetical protein